MSTITGGMTLGDALAFGQGVERPFRCEVHEDSMASASVNVVKGVWYCHACHATGAVDSKKAPSVEALQAMIRPEKIGRIYSPAFLELYETPVYWLTRFPDWLCHTLQLGEDPFTGDATFAVHTPEGLLAGVGRRKQVVEEKASRYLYPRNWSSGSTLFGTAGRYQRHEIIALGEGAADAAAIWETGCPGLAVYGAGLHMPQRELLARYAPRLILLGFDMDEAGERAVTNAYKMVGRMAAIKRVRWPAKDPGDTPLEERREALYSAVRAAGYGVDVLPRWAQTVEQMKSNHRRYVEER